MFHITRVEFYREPSGIYVAEWYFNGEKEGWQRYASLENALDDILQEERTRTKKNHETPRNNSGNIGMSHWDN